MIKKGSVIAAGALVRENTVVEPLSLMAGVPAKPIRALPPETVEQHLRWAAKYVKVAEKHRIAGFAAH